MLATLALLLSDGLIFKTSRFTDIPVFARLAVSRPIFEKMPRVVSTEEQVEDKLKNELAEMKAELERLKREKTELIRQNHDLQRRQAGGGDGSSNVQLRLEVQDMKTTLVEITKKLDGVTQETGRLSELHLQTIEEVRRINRNVHRGDGGGRQEQQRINVTETIIMFGGTGDGLRSDVYMFNYSNNTWDVFAFPEDVITSCRAAVHLNGEIYFIGCLKHQRRELEERQYSSDSTHVCKLTSDLTWKQLPLTLYNHFSVSKSCVAYENCLWIIGGTVHHDEVHFNQPRKNNYDLALDGTTNVEKYDPETDSWTEMPKLKYPRQNASGIVIGTKIYVCGGNFREDIIECFDATSQRWIDICRMPCPRTCQALLADGNNLIALGGLTLNENVVKVNLGSATSIGMPSLPEARANFSAFRFGETILAIGGHVKSKKKGFTLAETTATVLSYDGRIWKNDGPALPYPRAVSVSVVIPVELGKKLKNTFG